VLALLGHWVLAQSPDRRWRSSILPTDFPTIYRCCRAPRTACWSNLTHGP